MAKTCQPAIAIGHLPDTWGATQSGVPGRACRRGRPDEAGIALGQAPHSLSEVCSRGGAGDAATAGNRLPGGLRRAGLAYVLGVQSSAPLPPARPRRPALSGSERHPPGPALPDKSGLGERLARLPARAGEHHFPSEQEGSPPSSPRCGCARAPDRSERDGRMALVEWRRARHPPSTALQLPPRVHRPLQLIAAFRALPAPCCSNAVHHKMNSKTNGPVYNAR